MSATVTWVRIEPVSFHTLYNNLGAALTVHSSYTRMDDDEELIRMGTEWGFKDASVGLIRSERRGKFWSYYIASVEVREDETECHQQNCSERTP